VVALRQPALVALVVVIGCVVLGGRGVQSVSSPGSIATTNQPAVTNPSSFTVRVTPPPHTRQPVQRLVAPAQMSVVAGSRIQIDAAGITPELRDWIATESTGLEVRTTADAPSQFLSVIVVPDAPPTVRVTAPGKDTAFATAAGRLPIAVQGSDDFGMASLALRFTKAAGGGENLTFTDGEVPLVIERTSERQWTGRATFVLDTMALEEGDMLVYRAIIRDSNPNGLPVQSDQYLIEIGKNSEIADAGFALPTEEKKYAISQQMVIYRTEQLLKSRARPGGGDAGEKWLEQTRMIAIEQRMVRAEVVFLGGGEVEDELEEAARSDELTEGRLQNTGRAEMLLAINAMSRAEAQLNDGRAQEALVFERQALASLERALDRRRYFLRTMPDRSRIDVTRRLTGERKEARSWSRESLSPSARSIEADRRMMRELATASTMMTGIDASLAARLTALDPASADIQRAALAIASASNNEARRKALGDAMQAVTAHALATMAASSTVGISVDPLGGRIADELKARGHDDDYRCDQNRVAIGGDPDCDRGADRPGVVEQPTRVQIAGCHTSRLHRRASGGGCGWRRAGRMGARHSRGGRLAHSLRTRRALRRDRRRFAGRGDSGRFEAPCFSGNDRSECRTERVDTVGRDGSRTQRGGWCRAGRSQARRRRGLRHDSRFAMGRRWSARRSTSGSRTQRWSMSRGGRSRPDRARCGSKRCRRRRDDGDR
jgi:hypothetical protein